MTLATNYEPETTRIFNSVLKEGDRVVIAGAHQGYFVTLASTLVGETGVVYAFEPEKVNYSILTESTKMFRNIRYFNHCIGDRNTKANFFVNKDNDGGHALFNVSVHPGNVKTKAEPETYEVDVKRLDDVLEDEDLSRLKLFLFDCEGSEQAVLKGAINTICDSEIPYIICEINNWALRECKTSQEELRSYLRTYGYTGYVMYPDHVDTAPSGHLKLEFEGGESVFNMLFSRKGKV